MYEYNLSMRMFFDIMSHRPEIFAGFLAHAMCCNILYSKYLQPRHLLGMSGQRYHSVIPLPECFGDRLSVRLHAYGKQKVGRQAMQGEDDVV